MNQTDDEFSTQNITPALISQIIEAVKNKAYGSVEIYIQNHTVTQITERTITKVAKGSGQRQKPKDPSPYSSSESDKHRTSREVTLGQFSTSSNNK